ncbi:MAG: hypothetical protein Q9207_006093 [Kuettlingeria erythrocarpa]
MAGLHVSNVELKDMRMGASNKPGLLVKSHSEDHTPGQHPYARDDSEWQGKNHKDLLSIVKEVKPHVLIGTSTKTKTFTEQVVREMAQHVDKPIIIPLSNPTRLHEADPKDIYEWTEGRALIATGSPFRPWRTRGKSTKSPSATTAALFRASASAWCYRAAGSSPKRSSSSR